VAWEGDQTGDYDVYGRIFSADGAGISNEFRINQITTFGQLEPAVTGLPNGNAFVAWSGSQTGNYDVYGRVFAANGTALNNEFLINQNTTSAQIIPSVASLTNGNAFVTWWGDQTGDYDIYGRVFSANGAALSNEFGINQITTGIQQTSPVASSVAGLTNGSAFVVWYGDQTGDYDIYGRLFSANGAPLGNEFSINQNATSAQRNPSVAGLTNGDAFVAWEDDQTGDYNIYGRILSLNGTATTGSSSTTIASTTNNPTTSQTVTTGSSSTTVIPTTTSLASTTNPTSTSTTQGIVSSTGSTFLSSTSMSSTLTSNQGSSTSTGQVSHSHKLTPSWILSPVMGIASGFKSLWNMARR